MRAGGFLNALAFGLLPTNHGLIYKRVSPQPGWRCCRSKKRELCIAFLLFHLVILGLVTLLVAPPLPLTPPCCVCCVAVFVVACMYGRSVRACACMWFCPLSLLAFSPSFFLPAVCWSVLCLVPCYFFFFFVFGFVTLCLGECCCVCSILSATYVCIVWVHVMFGLCPSYWICYLPPPPQKKKPKYPPKKRGNLWAWRFSCRKKKKKTIFPGAHKVGAAISGPRVAGKTFYGHKDFFLK